MLFLRHDEIQASLAKLVKGKRLLCAVAFWGDGAAAHFELPREGQDVRILCNLSMGGTNPFEIERLGDAGIPLRQIDTLHAKVYIGDDDMVVTSANASCNGLGFEGRFAGNWIEAGAVGPVQKKALDWFEGLWAAAAHITPGDLERAKHMWAARPFAVPRAQSFEMFDPDSQHLPLVDWYGGGEWVANEESIARQLGRQHYTSQFDAFVDNSLDVLGPGDEAALTEGRWVLRWKRTRGVKNAGAVSRRTPLEWLQVGRLIMDAYRDIGSDSLTNVRFPAERAGPQPFDATEARFRVAFIDVVEREAFDELRAEYDGEWNTPARTSLLRPFWITVKEQYMELNR